MRSARNFILKAVFDLQPPEKRDALKRFLPEEERLALEQLPPFQEPKEKMAYSLVDHVHWSWFLPTLKSYPKQVQPLFLGALSPNAAQNLSQQLNIKAAPVAISDTGRSFLRQTLEYSLARPKDHLLPIDYLPTSPLNALLHLTKKELIQLIDFLSLYDLATELRQIVETKILKKIYSFLREEERRFLKVAAAQKEPFPIPRMGLERWDGTKEGLFLLLHRRGIARLGAALAGQDPDLIWYLCHQLDIGRGSALFAFCEKETASSVSEWIARQIEEWLATNIAKL